MNKEYIQKRAMAMKMLAPQIVASHATKRSGIYVWHRVDEEGIHWFYAGQAVDIYNRQISHYLGYKQDIDFSLRKRGFRSAENPHGWWIEIPVYCDKEQLDARETEIIHYYMSLGYQSYNRTLGSQGVGKESTDIRKPAKGYYDGLEQGYKNARRFVAKLFDKNLKVEIQGSDGVRKQRALEKFNDFINIEEETEEE